MKARFLCASLLLAGLGATSGVCEERIVRSLPSVREVCSDDIVVSHESNDVLFDLVDRYHSELLEQFRRLVSQAAKVRFVYVGSLPKERRPSFFDSVSSPEHAARSCDARLEVKAEISFLGENRFAITSYVGVLRNQSKSDGFLSNADRGVLDLWRTKDETEPFEREALRAAAHRHALRLAEAFATAHRGGN